MQYPKKGECRNTGRTRFKKGYVSSRKGKKFPNQSGENHPRWKGGKTIDICGYVHILKKTHPSCDCYGYVLEHRYILEKHLSRFLNRKESIHHINEIKTDNSLKNFILFATESAHQRFHKDPTNVKPEEIIFDGRKLVI